MITPEQLDHTPLTKGKHKGKTPSQVALDDPSYVVWMCENWDVMPCSKLLYEECQGWDGGDFVDDEPKFR